MLSACGGTAEATPAPEVLNVQVGDLAGTFQKPAGCNDPCSSIYVSFSATSESLAALNPDYRINWGDGTPEEQLMQGTHTYPAGDPREYEVTLRGDTVSGPATGSVVLKTKIMIPFVLPPEAPLEEEVPVEGE